MRRGGGSAVLYVPGDGVYSDKTAAGMEKYLYFIAGFVLYYTGWITIGEFYDGESVV